MELLNKNTIRYLLYENQFTSYIDTMWNLNKSFGRTYSYKGNIIIPIYENYVVKYSIERENYFKVIIDKSKLKLNPLDKNKKRYDKYIIDKNYNINQLIKYYKIREKTILLILLENYKNVPSSIHK